MDHWGGGSNEGSGERADRVPVSLVVRRYPASAVPTRASPIESDVENRVVCRAEQRGAEIPGRPRQTRSREGLAFPKRTQPRNGSVACGGQAPGSWRLRPRVVVGALLVGVGLLAAACGAGGTASGGSSSVSIKAGTKTTDSAPTTTTSPAATAVLQAYRAGWAAFEHALADANPEDPALTATMVDPQLQQVKANLLADQRQGMVGRGTTTLHPKISALSATSATVVDCAYSTAELVYQATGKPVPPVTPPENDGVTSTLVLSAGTWKVAKQIVTDGKCGPPGS